MAKTIQALFIDPPLAFARLGGSSVPQAAFEWAPSDEPHLEGETVVRPTWSLNVSSDGSVEPFLPAQLTFRDGATIRPVAPFFEVWALMGEAGSDRATWEEAPVTPALLAENGAGLGSLNVRIDARNRKAERRTNNPGHAFGTFPPVEIAADDHAPRPLKGVSPPGGRPPMIPARKHIPLGRVQVLRSLPQATFATAPWAGQVSVEVIRLRFTPATGLMYGPPDAAVAPPPRVDRLGPAVGANEAFLNPAAQWAGSRVAASSVRVEPADTVDGAEDGNRAISTGVVDDTCEARITVTLAFPGPAKRTLEAETRVFVGPPDFAPDRRPFLSAADELNDRVSDQAARSQALSADETTEWVQDLFERIYETVSLFNVDCQRREHGAPLPASQQRPPIAGDGLSEATIDVGDGPVQGPFAMSDRDALRDPDILIAASTPDAPLPLSERARSRHRVLADVLMLRDFVLEHPDRLATLVRRPFATRPNEARTGRMTMEMPPFMRQSNAGPLSLAPWQYQLLIGWAAAVNAGTVVPALAFAATGGAPRPRKSRSAGAHARQRSVLSALNAGPRP